MEVTLMSYVAIIISGTEWKKEVTGTCFVSISSQSSCAIKTLKSCTLGYRYKKELTLIHKTI